MSTTPLRSASAIVAGTESGQHLLKIDGFSLLTKNVSNGTPVRSRSFRAGGHGWHILFYPNGKTPDSADYVSVFLSLDRAVTPDGVRAWYSFGLLPGHVAGSGSAPLPAYTCSSGEARVFCYAGWGFPSFIKRDVLEKSGHLRDDCFTIQCDLKVVMEIRTEDVDVRAIQPPPPPPAVEAVPPSDLHQHLGGLLASGDGADVTFLVDGKTFPAHRCVLAARSPAFRAELFGAGAARESAAAESTVVVRVDDMEARDFEALLGFVYTDSLPPETAEAEGGGEDAAAMLPDLIAAANRYGMERLRLVCEERLRRYVGVSTVAIMLRFAEQHRCHGLKEVCLEFLKDPANMGAVLATNGLEHLIAKRATGNSALD